MGPRMDLPEMPRLMDKCGMEIGTHHFKCPDDAAPDGWHLCVGDKEHPKWHHCTCGTTWADPDW